MGQSPLVQVCHKGVGCWTCPEHATTLYTQYNSLTCVTFVWEDSRPEQERDPLLLSLNLQGLVLVTLDVVNLIPGRGLGPQVRAHHTGARPAGIQQCYSLI